MLLLMLVISSCWRYGAANMGFTRIVCNSLDKSYFEIRRCNLIADKTGLKSLDIYVAVNKKNVTDITMNLSLWQKGKGYHPFLYNYTTDFCKFLVPKRKTLFLKIYFDLLRKHSNLNHTCPYNHDIFIKDITLRNEYVRLIPRPLGEYMINFKVAVHNVWKSDVKIYYTLR